MMLLAPLFILGAAAIVLPLILHFLRRKPTIVQRFPSLKFLGASVLKSARVNSIRRWLVLLTRCAIFSLLALAFARPLLSTPYSNSATALMVVLDTSYSMSAGDQFSKSKAEVIQSLKSLSASDYAGLVVANGHPKVVIPLGHDIDQVIRAVSQQEVSFEANDYENALRTADSQLAQAPCGTRELDLFGDSQYLAWSTVDFQRPLSPGVRLKVEPSDPRIISDVSVDDVKIPGRFQSANQKMTAEIIVKNRSAGDQERTVTVSLDGHEVASAAVKIHAGDAQNIVIPFTAGALQPTKGGVNLDADAFSVNDTRYFVLNPVASLRAGVWPVDAQGGADVLSAALAPREGLSSITPVSIGNTADLDPCDVLVIRPPQTGETYGSQEAALVNAVQQGKPCLVFANDGPESLNLLRLLGIDAVPRPASDQPLYFGAINFSHPELALFAKPGSGDLFRVRFSKGPQITSVDSQTVLASFQDGSPAILKTKFGQGRILLVCSGLDRVSTTWPFQSTFLPFVQESLKHLAESNEIIEQVMVGQPLPGEHPGENSDKPGIVSTQQAGVRTLVAVNLDPAESDLTPWTNELETQKLSANPGVPASIPDLNQSHSEEVEQHQQIWWYALVAVVSLLFLEMFLANRTPP